MNLARDTGLAAERAPQDAPAASPGTASALYTGWVRHRRHAPHRHAFRYRLFLAYLDLSEIDRVFSRRWLWSVDRRNVVEFRRSDYLGDPAVPLDTAVRDCVEQRGLARPLGPIRLLAHLRYFGYCFNPVSFYYCFAEDGHTLQAVVAEVTNTPWKERYAYVLSASACTRQGDVLAWRFDKRLHVSPFMAMTHSYAWRLGIPGEELRVHMDVLALDAPIHDASREFDATMVLKRKPLDARNAASALLRFPLMTLRVVAAIHWQALRLWLRGNPIHDHPATRIQKP